MVKEYCLPLIVHFPPAIRLAHLPTTNPSLAIVLLFHLIESIVAPVALNLTTKPFDVDNSLFTKEALLVLEAGLLVA